MGLQTIRHFRAWVTTVLVLAMVQISGLACAGPAEDLETETPIKHLVVIFQENKSFFSYFATYPVAENPTGGTPLPQFEARPGTPSVNGLDNTLANFNPNLVNPFRIARLDSYTCDQNHDYQAELEARNQGLMNMFDFSKADKGKGHKKQRQLFLNPETGEIVQQLQLLK